MLPLYRLHLVWGLGFANAPLLYGLAAASVPILIHLLNRRKHREQRWAAMRFLIAAIRKNQRRIRIEQWLLLAIRCLLVLLVVSAMAKPFLESFGSVISGRRTHRVLVLDSSLSMGYTASGSSRFDQAKTVASQLVKDSRRGDAVSVVLMGDPPRVVIGDPSPNLAEVQKEIQELVLGHAGTDLDATFEAVDRVLDVSTIPQKEVVFLTDLQSTSWRPRPSDGKEGLARIVAKLEARRPRSVVIDLGRAGSENRAIVDLQVQSPVVTPATTVLVRAVVHNFGPSKAEGVRVRLTVDGRVGPEQLVDLPVGEDVPVVFNQQFSSPGDHVVEASIDEDALPLDDHRRLVVPVRESVNVLLVDGDFKSEPFQAETDYLAQALAPTEGSPGEPNMMRVEVVSESQLARRDLKAFDVVGLCNVAQFSQTEVDALEDFLKQGGGVIVFSGDQVMPDNYNRLLYADGKGLLPAAVGAPVGDAAKKESAFGFNPLGYRHPLLAEFRNQADPVVAGLTRTLTWRYHKLTLSKDSTAQVALAFENGDPALIEAPRHRGKVFQAATSADAGWTNWPVHHSYPPIMQRMILEAAAGRSAERNIRVGQPYDQSFDPSAAGASATVLTPRGQSLPAKLKAAGGVSQLHFVETDASGAYEVKIGPPLATEVAFAANPDPAESDLAKLERASLAERLPGWNFIHLTNWRELAQNAASVGRRGELHRPLLYGVLLLLLVESITAWKFGHNDPSS
ncbi:BatA domain-containing protein [Paludisphaera borealis]|uniref:VWFA domain-containing protein n=1 Tax=Paludisphaera borealis TaxID=1387353 RepID=A0A1U7CYG4_9BACT|nr:BatA domain-containing protein [Paludisphaera borealis]APW63975.1 hypothetical protein BSF38_05563 [Paludisphaera borealis]